MEMFNYNINILNDLSEAISMTDDYLHDCTKNNPKIRDVATVPLLLVNGAVAVAHVYSFSGLCDQNEHIAVKLGDITDSCPLVRIHSECLTGDVLGSSRCDCGPQLQESLNLLNDQGGVLLYLRQEGRGIGLYNKIRAYGLQEKGHDTYEANRLLGFPDDARDYAVAAEMLSALGIKKIKLLSNNPDKRIQLEKYGIQVDSMLRTGVFEHENNKKYLEKKVAHTSHTIHLDNKE